MAFDGIFMHQLSTELSSILIGGRIDKIHQPEKDELYIHIRSRDGNKILFISIESTLPYLTLVNQKKENPLAPPMFCMLLRKHLIGGKITAVEQHGNERIILFEVESKNELGIYQTKKIIVEIMGKHSNIILTKDDYTIIDSIKRITPDISRIRSILPGLKYEFLPSKKISISSYNPLSIIDLGKEAKNQKIYKLLYESIEGMSPLSSKYILNKADIDPELSALNLSNADLIRIQSSINHFVEAEKSKGYIYYDASNLPRELYFLEDIEGFIYKKEFNSLHEATDSFYSNKNKQLKNHQRTNDLKKFLNQRLERSQSKLKKLELELKQAENSEHYKIMGELIIANIFQISKGMNSVFVNNYYEEGNPLIEISLDIRLEPSENAQKYFKLYSKQKTALNELSLQLNEAIKESEYLDQVITLLNTIEEPSELDGIRQELINEGFLKAKYQKKKSKPAKESFRKYISSEGFEILVGKNNVQNDYLTTKLASNRDIWLHTKSIAGSHVIIRTEGNDIGDNTLYEAGVIAAYYSKARDSSNVPVDYTFVKNVSKPSGAKPGMVIYVNNKTIYVTPNEEIIKKLKSLERSI